MKQFTATYIFFTIMVMVFFTSLAFGQDLNTNLIHYFPFNGTHTDQITGGGYLNGELEYVDSTHGQAAKFDGNGQIELPFDGMEEWVISFWVKADSFPSEYWYSIVGTEADIFEGTAGKYNFCFTLYYNQWPDMQYESYNSDADHMMHPGTPFYANTLYHIVSVKKEGIYKIYLNGNLANQSNGDDVPVVNGMPLIIGGKTTSFAQMFKGEIDELRIYNVGNDDADFITELYNASESDPVVDPVVDTNSTETDPCDPALMTDSDLSSVIDLLLAEAKSRVSSNEEWSKYFKDNVNVWKNKYYWGTNDEYAQYNTWVD